MGTLVNGNWSIWENWGLWTCCTQTGSGQWTYGTQKKLRSRKCNNPIPVASGKYCEGPGTELVLNICDPSENCLGITKQYGQIHISLVA